MQLVDAKDVSGGIWLISWALFCLEQKSILRLCIYTKALAEEEVGAKIVSNKDI